VNKEYQLDTHWKAMLGVALPVSLGIFVQFIVVFTDNYFVSRIGENAMSAAAFVGLIYLTLTMIGVGMSNAVQIVVARKRGEEKIHEVGAVVSNGLWMSVLIAFVQFAILYWLIPPLLEKVLSSAEIIAYMKAFIVYRAWGFFAHTPLLVLEAFWSGIARTRVMIYTVVITAGVNVVLDYALVFGAFGFPHLGMPGAALATFLAESTALIFLLSYTLRHDISRHYGVVHQLFSRTTNYTAQLFRLGGPISMQMLLALGIWSVFYEFVESIGERELNSSFIVRNLYMLCYVGVGGFSTLTKTYVSGLIAEKRQHELIPVARRIMFMNFCGILLMSHGLWLYPGSIAGTFTSDPQTIVQAVNIMHIVLPAMLTFSCTSIMLAMVEGSGNTMAGFAVELITTCVYIGCAWYFVYELHWPIHLVWIADYVYFILIGVLSLLFLWNGKWKYKVL
jgi:multidrug resistance protein, MATE family